jgi:hypothetical protein
MKIIFFLQEISGNYLFGIFYMRLVIDRDRWI